MPEDREFKLRLIQRRYSYLTGEMEGIKSAMELVFGDKASALLIRYMNRYRERQDVNAEAIKLGHGGTLD